LIWGIVIWDVVIWDIAIWDIAIWVGFAAGAVPMFTICVPTAGAARPDR
jgi:hypothetical protein